MNKTTQKKTEHWYGFAIVGASIAILLGIAYLKGRADSEHDLDFEE